MAHRQPRKNEGEGGAVAETVEAAVILEDGEPVAIVAEIPEGESEMETGDENEGVSDAVAIAAIEADEHTRIAEIQADVEIIRIEAEQERERSWQEVAADLQANMLALTTRVEEMTAVMQPPAAPDLSTPPVLTESEALEIETVGEPNLTPEFTPDLTSETPMEAGSESAEESAEAPERRVRRRRRLI